MWSFQKSSNDLFLVSQILEKDLTNPRLICLAPSLASDVKIQFGCSSTCDGNKPVCRPQGQGLFGEQVHLSFGRTVLQPASSWGVPPGTVSARNPGTWQPDSRVGCCPRSLCPVSSAEGRSWHSREASAHAGVPAEPMSWSRRPSTAMSKVGFGVQPRPPASSGKPEDASLARWHVKP